MAMKNLNDMNSSPKTPHRRRGLADVWHWLIEPSSAVVEPERRLQARLLMAMLLVLIFLGLLSLTLSLLGVYSQPGKPETVGSIYDWITIPTLLVLAAAYGLSRGIHYPVAALMTVGVVMIATFGSTILNPQDFRIIFFLILGGLIGSLFLSARATAIIFLVTFIGLFLLPALAIGISTSNNISVLFFILMVGALVVMAASLRERYLDQIDVQTSQLLQSEVRLRELSIRDPLTGLFNRRYLEEMLTVEMIRAARKQYPIGIIMVDIDHFKRFNDTHGHAAGDAILIEVGNFLRTHVRASDITCRYGGEEFIMALPEASQEITEMRARHMQEDVSQLLIQHDGQTLEAITLSLGVAIFPEHGLSYDAILGAADTALYRAKSNGRDQVVVAEHQRMENRDQ
ncbi:MAG: diguanylate cyclase [Anaerolineales bacterium]|nr:diguanylate cyclase [Anaerolineales bacterium]